MAAPDEEQLFRDDLEERRRERDRQREPRHWRRVAPDHRTRQAFQARVVDTRIVTLECPICRGPVCAPANSHDERIDCVGCDARLVTIRTAEGVAAVLAPGGAP